MGMMIIILIIKTKKMIYFKALWLSQPLCLGLTRLSGGLLFGSMILLGFAAIGGLIASIVLYNQGKKNKKYFLFFLLIFIFR